MPQTNLAIDPSNAGTQLKDMALVIGLLYNSRQRDELEWTVSMETRYVEGLFSIQKSLEELRKALSPKIKISDVDPSERRSLELSIKDARGCDSKKRLDVLREQAKDLIDQAKQLYSSNKGNQSALPAFKIFETKIGLEIHTMHIFFEKGHPYYSRIANQRIHTRRT